MSERETHAQMAVREVLEHFDTGLAERLKHERLTAECRRLGYIERHDRTVATLYNPANNREVTAEVVQRDPDAALRWLGAVVAPSLHQSL